MADLLNLSAQGRAYSPLRPWTPEEFEAVLLLEKERDISRIIAADYVRNGVMTLEDYDRAKKANFVPAKLSEATQIAEKAIKEHEFATPPAEEVTPEVEAPAEEVAPEVEAPADAEVEDKKGKKHNK